MPKGIRKSDRRRASLEEEHRNILDESARALEKSAQARDLLAKKIFELITGHPGATGTEELEALLKETSEEVRVAALQKAATLTRSPSLTCSFCGKSHNEVKKLIASHKVCICNECIDICNEIIADDQQYLPTAQL